MGIENSAAEPESSVASPEPTLDEKFNNLSSYFRGEFAIERHSPHMKDGCLLLSIVPRHDKPETRERIGNDLKAAGIPEFHFMNDGPRPAAPEGTTFSADDLHDFLKEALPAEEDGTTARSLNSEEQQRLIDRVTPLHPNGASVNPADL